MEIEQDCIRKEALFAEKSPDFLRVVRLHDPLVRRRAGGVPEVAMVHESDTKNVFSESREKVGRRATKPCFDGWDLAPA